MQAGRGSAEEVGWHGAIEGGGEDWRQRGTGVSRQISRSGALMAGFSSPHAHHTTPQLQVKGGDWELTGRVGM